jgi:uncharacterized protein (TIGR02001 family)
MRKGILLAVVILLSVSGLAGAEEGELGVTLDVTYVSRYIWRGIDLYANDHSAIQPSIDLDLWGSGFGVKVWDSMSNGGGSYVDSEEMDIIIYYGSSLLEGDALQTDYTLGWMYYSYPDAPKQISGSTGRGGRDAEEIFASFSWPNICPAGIVPSYTYIYMWPAEGGSNSAFRKCDGSIHVFGLGYDVDVEGQPVNLSVAATYNDGTYLRTVKHDWSHIVWGISSAFPVAENLTFTPGFYYQTSMEDTVNTEDEYWTSLSLTYKF